MLTAADTAFSIALVRANESELPVSERLFEDPYAALFSAGGAHAAEGTKRFFELTFFVEAVRLRTRFIDDFVRAALQGGIEQVVLLGAGFDTRGLRMPEIAARNARVYEVDFEEQLERKRALLAAGGVALPGWIEYVGSDFNAPDFDDVLAARLGERGFREGAGAVFVWEGVIAYIGADAVERSLCLMARIGGPGSRLVFDFAPIAFDPDPAAERTRRAGFTRFEQVGNDELYRRHMSGEPHENLSVIQMGTAFV